MKKTQIVELCREQGGEYNLKFGKGTYDTTLSFCGETFKKFNPAICKGMEPGQTRKLKRTQLKNGFKLEIL